MQEAADKEKLSSQENEVWNNVENYTKLIMENDFNGFLEYFHNGYSGWNYTAFLPIKKSDIQNELLHLPRRKVIWYELIPLAISIFKEVAIVHYIYSVKYQDANGNEKEKSGKNTDMLIKEKNKWLIIADNSGTRMRKHK